MGVDRMKTSCNITQESRSGESGFSLVEIVVAMFLIGVLAMSVLPVLMQSLTATATNITFATATQMVNDQMDIARSRVQDCADLAAYISEVPPPVTDSQKVVLQATRTAATCSDAQLDAVSVTITVTRNDNHRVMANATTLLTVQPSPSPTPEP
jgi:prepilin-type N-terminal cleavage/methylation domain-containing protein